MSSYKICNYCDKYEHDCRCLAARRIAKLEQLSRKKDELIEKLVEALKTCRWAMIEPNRSMKHYDEPKVKAALSLAHAKGYGKK